MESAPATEPGDETTEDVPNPADSAPGTEANGGEDDSPAESSAADDDAAAEPAEGDAEAPEANAAEEKETDEPDATSGADPATTADADPGDAAADGDGEPDAAAPASPATETADAGGDAASDEAGGKTPPPPLGDPEAFDARKDDAGVDVDAEGTYDVVRGPPLLWAAVAVRNGEDANGLALAEVLLSADANPNLRGSYGPTAVGVTPLMLAAQAAPENGWCVRLCAALLEAGATMEANEVSSLLMYRVGSSLVAVKNLLKGGRGD